MHDKNGTELKVGDLVLVPAKITSLNSGEDYCNVSIETLHGRRPDGAKETMGAINTGVLVLHERPDEKKAEAGFALLPVILILALLGGVGVASGAVKYAPAAKYKVAINPASLTKGNPGGPYNK